MFDRHFFTSKLGVAALVSIAAMVTFNIYVVTQQIGMTPSPIAAVEPFLELA
jgi:hypothetical protein